MNERRVPSPTIALVHTQLDGFYQSLIWRGARAAARLHGARLVTFLGKALGSPVEDECAHNSIFDIIPLVAPDALIISTNTLGNFCGTEAIVEWVSSHLPELPTASIGEPLPKALHLEVRQDGQGLLVDHLIQVHGCRRIGFIAGPASNPDANARKAEYRASLERNGLEYRESLVEAADFMSSRVPEALSRLLERHPDLDALVAANDPMAIAACRELARRGIGVPRQIKVVGYDDIDEAHHQAPALTTVRAPIFHIGAHAVECSLEQLGLHKAPAMDFVTHCVVRTSCGCLLPEDAGSEPTNPLLESLAQRLLDPQLDLEDFLHDMIDCLRDADDRINEDWARVLHQLRNHLATHFPERIGLLAPTLERCRNLLFQMAQGYHARAHFDLQTQTKILLRQAQWILLEPTLEGIASRLHDALLLWGARGRLWILEHTVAGTSPACLDLAPYSHAFDLGGAGPLPLDPKGDLLPPFVEGDSWVALPLCTGNEQYGVLLVTGDLPAESFHEGLRFMATNALRAAHLLERERRLAQELRELSLRDPLTGLLNRRGFLELGRRLESQARRDGRRLGVLFADLDGLKTINDTWGHADGDQAIAALGRALSATFRESDCLSRLGGDEFAALYVSTGETRAMQERLESRLDTISGELGRPWQAKASLGWIDWDPKDSSLEEALERADAQLYLVKRRRKLLAQGARLPESGAGPDAED